MSRSSINSSRQSEILFWSSSVKFRGFSFLWIRCFEEAQYFDTRVRNVKSDIWFMNFESSSVSCSIFDKIEIFWK